ncbi:MAG: PDZ domain-containing protein, partial [Gemmatimonadaceae bacterium]
VTTTRLLLAASVAMVLAHPCIAQSILPVPISQVRYDVTFDSSTAQSRLIDVKMSFLASAPGTILLSLPAWTPGAYEISNYARFVDGFAAIGGSDSLRWDKADPDTWRISATKAGPVTVAFSYRADSLDNAMSWSKNDFAFFNGTNLFLHPDDQSGNDSASVTIHTTTGWRVITGMKRGLAPNTFIADNYDDLVDMPFFVGRFDLDSATIAGKPLRFASYPAGSVAASARSAIFQQLAPVVAAQVKVFGRVPWDSYTILQVADENYTLGGASGLEHQNSHLDILSPVVLGNPILPSLYAHEIFHAWNVKRLRPAEMTPYRYDRVQPTTLLWISEGITDYYADISLLRGKAITRRDFYHLTVGKIEATSQSAPIALEDASLSTWIHPVNGAADIYYDKGSVAGVLLDIMIRDASDNRQSLDNVMRDLYENTYGKGKGFTNEDWWNAVTRAASGRSMADFERRFVDGREAFPYDSVLPLAGLQLIVERTVTPSLGVSVSADDDGLRVMQVVVAGPGATAGVILGDYLLKVGELDAADPEFQEKFNAKYGALPPGGTIALEIRRGTQRMTLNAPVRFNTVETRRLIEVSNASPRALRVRDGLLTGTLQQ